MDYKKMTLETMLDWIVSNKPDEKLDFAKEAIIVSEGEKSKKNTREAKAYFYNKYKNDIQFENAPKPKEKKKDIIQRLEEILKEQ